MHKNTNLDSIRTFFDYFIKLSDEDWEMYASKLHPVEYSKGDIITRIGDVERYLYFMYDGIVRTFYVYNDIEYTIGLYFPIAPLSGLTSYLTRKPAMTNLQCITDAKMFKISYFDLESLYEKSRYIERLSRHLIENAFVYREWKEMKIQSQAASDFYLDLLKEKPHIIEQVPLKYMASYLGIAPESLSRIRRNIKTKEKTHSEY